MSQRFSARPQGTGRSALRLIPYTTLLKFIALLFLLYYSYWLMKPRIVIADNFQPFLHELHSLLSGRFDIVAVACSGRSALEAIRRHQPKVAILDLDLPDLNGIQVAKELATDSVRPAIVI